MDWPAQSTEPLDSVPAARSITRVMRFCEICREPSARGHVSMSPDQQTTIKYYCFVHAIEGGLLRGPLAQLPAVATNTGYSKNAVVFVIEALSQRECLTKVDGQRPMWSITAPTKTADQFCIAIRLGTIEHFDFHEHLVLKHWKLIRGADIGLILSRLAAADVLGLEGARAAQVVEDLRATQRELLTFPYGEY